MMRAILGQVIPLSLILLLGQGVCVSAEFPKPKGPVNDFAGVIPQSEQGKMEILATEVLQKTGTAVVVVTQSTIEGADAASYANELYQDWGIGKKGEDKGVLIFLALKERRIWIETGYGVEGILPDGRVGEILDRYALPLLKKDQYGKGLYNALAAVSAVIAKDAGVDLTGEIKIYRAPRRQSRGISPRFLFFLILIPLLFFRRRGGILPLLLLSSMGGRGGFGGGFGGFSGGFGGFGGGMSGGGGAGRGF